MKKITYILILSLIIACGKKKDFTKNAASIKDLKQELINKFGKEAFYTELAVINNENGITVKANTTKDPSSLKMESWNYFNGAWNQTAKITLELSGDSKAADYMYKLNREIVNFDLLGKLVEQSKNKVIEEKKIKEVFINSIFINAPNDGDFNNMEYYLTVISESDGASFNFWYKMDGTLRKFD